jgi:hypothetical protein
MDWFSRARSAAKYPVGVGAVFWSFNVSSIAFKTRTVYTEDEVS